MDDYFAFTELFHVGLRFVPTPQELITHYLLPKVRNETPHPYSPIKDCDVYNEEHIWRKECDEYNKVLLRNTRYYFTQLKLKTSKGRRKDRETTTGVWKAEKDVKIKAGNKDKLHIGSVRSFSYKPNMENKNKEGIKGRSWSMHEYRLDGKYKNIPGSSTLVLCKIKEIKRSKKSNEADKEVEHMISNNTSTTSTSTDHVQEVGEAALLGPQTINRTMPPQEEEEKEDEDMEYLLSLLEDDAVIEDFDQFMSNFEK